MKAKEFNCVIKLLSFVYFICDYIWRVAGRRKLWGPNWTRAQAATFERLMDTGVTKMRESGMICICIDWFYARLAPHRVVILSMSSMERAFM